MTDRRPPRPAASADAARWLTDRIDLWGPHWVTNLVGSGFPACARLFHPLDDYPGALRWADEARFNGRTMHASAQWERISSPAPFDPDSVRRGRSHPGAPQWGHLGTRALGALCGILARHTATPQACYFAVWEGWGSLRGGGPTITAFYAPDGKRREVEPPPPAPAEWQLDLSGPTFPIHRRNNYHLFEGHIGEAVRIGRWDNVDVFCAVSPQFIWPADHAWCVATEIDDDSTFIGGARALVDELCASEAVEVLEIAPDAPFEDRLNP